VHLAESLPVAQLASRASGTFKPEGKGSRPDDRASQTTGDTIHTLCTSNGSPYLNFQTRIMWALPLPLPRRSSQGRAHSVLGAS